MNWNEVSAISTAVQAIIVIAAATLALWQLQEALTARRMAGFLRLMDELESGTVQQTRRFFNAYQKDVCQIADTGNLQELDKFLSRKTRRWQQPLSLGGVRDDLTKLEYTAMLCLHGMLPIKLERTYFTTVVVLTWPYIEPVVLSCGKPAAHNICNTSRLFTGSMHQARYIEEAMLVQGNAKQVA